MAVRGAGRAGSPPVPRGGARAPVAALGNAPRGGAVAAGFSPPYTGSGIAPRITSEVQLAASSKVSAD